MTGVSLPELTRCLVEKEDSIDESWKGEALTAASAAYLNNPVERTAHSAGSVLMRGPVLVGRRSPSALCHKGIDQMTDTGTNTLPVWFVAIAWAACSLILNVLVFATASDKPPLPVADFGHRSTNLICYRVLFLCKSPHVFTQPRSLLLDSDASMAGRRRDVPCPHVVRLIAGYIWWPQGSADLTAGAYAPFVVLAILRRPPGWHKHVVLLNVLGRLEFIRCCRPWRAQR